MTWSDAGELILKGLGIVGGAGAILIGSAAFFAKLFADRSMQKHKAEMDADLVRIKGELDHKTESLKAELNRETETHKLKLRKAEILFAKEMDAAEAFFALRDHIYPKFDVPDKDGIW